MTWAAEALLNDADGYYGGFHNFYLYDQGPEGVRLPAAGHGRDVRLAGAVRSAGRRPITRCSGGRRARSRRRRRARTGSIVMSRRRLAAEVRGRDRGAAGQLGRRRRSRAGSTPGRSRSPPTSRPIRTAWATRRRLQHGGREGARDRRRRAPTTCARSSPASRTATARTRTATARAGATTAATTTPSIHVGAPEMCNGVDDNCNGTVDEGCQLAPRAKRAARQARGALATADVVRAVVRGALGRRGASDEVPSCRSGSGSHARGAAVRCRTRARVHVSLVDGRRVAVVARGRAPTLARAPMPAFDDDSSRWRGDRRAGRRGVR